MALDVLGYLFALHVTPASEQVRSPVAEMTRQMQGFPGDNVQIMFVDQRHTGGMPKHPTAAKGIELQVVKRPEAKKGLVSLPRRWVVDRSIGVWRYFA